MILIGSARKCITAASSMRHSWQVRTKDGIEFPMKDGHDKCRIYEEKFGEGIQTCLYAINLIASRGEHCPDTFTRKWNLQRHLTDQHTEKPADGLFGYVPHDDDVL